MSEYLLILSTVALFASPPVVALAQHAEAPPPELLCGFNSDRLLEKYPGLDSSPYAAVSEWGVAHLQQALVSRGCTGLVTDGSSAIDVTDDVLSRLDADHVRAFEILKPLLGRSESEGILGVVQQVGRCELNTRYVYASRPELPYADGRVYVTRLDEITSIDMWDSGRGFRFFGGIAGRRYTEFDFETEAETRTYANAFAALAAPCMRRASDS